MTFVKHNGHYGRDDTGRFLAYYGQHNRVVLIILAQNIRFGCVIDLVFVLS